MTFERPTDPPWAHELEPAAARARLRWARSRGHPRYVWPELPVAEWRAALHRLEGVVRRVLLGERPALMEGGGAGARALGIAAYSAGVGPLVGGWLEAGELTASEGVSSLLGLHLWHGRERATRQASQLESAVSALAAAGLEPLVVKSAHVGRAYYTEPGLRPSVDVDLVVPPAVLSTAESALEGAGFVRAARQTRPPKSDWLPAGVEPYPRSLELLHSGSHYGIDLQSTLARNFFGVRVVDLAGGGEVATRSAPELVAGARVLEQPYLLAYHALHASEGIENLTLIRLVDLVLMARRDGASGALDWSALEALLERARAARFVYPALALAERLIPGTFPSALMGRLESAAPSTMRRAVAARTPGTAPQPELVSLRERFMWCATRADHVRRALHMLVPAPVGRSPLRLTSQYLERFYRVIRGRVRLSGPSRIGRGAA